MQKKLRETDGGAAMTIARCLTLLILLGGAVIGFRAEAQAPSAGAIAVTSSNLNLRAGPGTQYPALQVIPRGGTVTLYGCIANYTWCDGVHRGARGWVSASYVQVWSQGRYLTIAQYAAETRLPVFTFNLRSYWDRYYASYPFYAQIDRWAGTGAAPPVQIGSFYDRLSPHGRWVPMNGQYVWVPATSANWRPYTDGRWVYSRRHGWTWVSNEPFGWATYHYGRWGYSHRVGWFWVPGTRWAPAWVSWRRSGDYIAWAPLPPDPRDPYAYTVANDPIPDYYWQPVQANLFLSINLANNIIRDDREKQRVIAATEQVGAVNAQEGTVVNAAIEPAFVEQVTQETVKPVEIVTTPNPEQQTSAETPNPDVVEIYQPPATEPPAAAPAEVTTIEAAAAESQTAGQAPADAPDTEANVPPPPPADQAPPPSEAPPPAAEAAATPPEGGAAGPVEQIVCPEGTTLQDGECILPAADTPPPPPEQPGVAPEAPLEQPAATAPPPAEQPAPPAPDEPAPAATEPPPPPAAETPPPPPAEDQAAPPPPAEEPAAPPPAPPAAEEPPPAPPTPEAAPEPAPQQQPPVCPEGTVLQDDGTCVPPPPAE